MSQSNRASPAGTWAHFDGDAEWIPAKMHSPGMWRIDDGDEAELRCEGDLIIGPRIPTPDEIAGQHEAQRQRIAQKIENSARLSKNRFAPKPSVEDDDGETDYRFSCDKD